HRLRSVVVYLNHAPLIEQRGSLLDRVALRNGDEYFLGDGCLQRLQDLDHVEVPTDFVGARLDVAVQVLVAGVEVENGHRVDQSGAMQSVGDLMKTRARWHDEPDLGVTWIDGRVQLMGGPVGGAH